MKRSIALVVDDDEDLAQFVVDCITRIGFQCVVATRIEDVTPLMMDAKVVLAIVDVFLPGIGGIEGIRKIKELNPGCRVVAISGGFRHMGGADALRAAQIVGADTVLSKPFRKRELVDTIDELLIDRVGPKSA